ncbi:MAG: response regulator [Prolixibacteraceae bacterium]|nr:response regulator [Prolixibacteraceae bacterium]
MKSPISVLIIEDSDNDKELLLLELRRGGYDPEYICVKTEKEMIAALDQREWELIISDYSMPKFSGFAALKIVKDRNSDIPFILVSGTIGEELAVKAMKEGASDYLMKGNLKRLIPAIDRELKDAKIRIQSKLADAALKESELRFRVLTESAPVGIFTTDASGSTDYVNPRWSEISKLSFGEALNDGWLKAVHPDDRKKLAFNWQQSTLHNSDSKAEYRFVHPDGTEAWVIGNAVKQEDKNGNLIGYIGTVTDITERKKMEAELIVAKENAEESDRLKTAFLQNISHEIRTPLNSIVGFSRIIADTELSAETFENYATIIENSSTHLMSIIDDIIQIATIESGQEKIQDKELNVNALCSQMYDRFITNAQIQNISLSYNTALNEDEAFTISDDFKLTQVLNNLIRNALKFTKCGFVSFGYQVVGSSLKFFVEDSGIGIATEMHEKIFKRFEQVESTATRKFGGSGLGLAISKSNVELLGGRIWVESEIGKGSKFYFTIPYKPTRVIKPEIIPLEHSINDLPNNLKILIVEDEKAVDIYLSLVLKSIGEEILHAQNGIEAVAICRKRPDFDLILMDIKMPEMNGYNAVREIRKFNPDVIIIAQTAYALSGDREKSIEAGCNDYITKPINRHTLHETLRRYFSV